MPATFLLGGGPRRSVTAFDADADGVADLAVQDEASGRAWLFSGDGAGGFGKAVEMNPAARPSVHAIGDFAGDGAEEEAILDTLAGTVKLRGGKGAVLVADLDGDGSPDFASVDGATSRVAVCLSDGRLGIRSAFDVALATPAVAIAAGHFNRDGIADLAVAERELGRITILLGDSSSGFSTSALLAAGIRPESIAVADFNGDGVADLAAADGAMAEVSLFLSGGDGFGERVILPFNPGIEKAVSASSSRIRAASHGPEVTGLTLNPATIAGGSGGASTATVTLSAPAPAGGAQIALASSNPELAASVLKITVPEGQTSATFTVATNPRYRRYSGLGFAVTITATNPANGASRSATLNVTAQPLPTDAVFSLDSDIKGPLCAGIQFINGEFRGDTGILYDCPLPSQGACKFKQECTLGCLTRPLKGNNWDDACATLGPFPLSIEPRTVVGGNPMAGALLLTRSAVDNSTASVTSNSLVARASINTPQAIPAGAASLPFDVFTARVDGVNFAFQDAHIRTIESGSSVFTTRHARTWVSVVPASGGDVAPPIALESLTLDLPVITGGLFTAATVKINQLAPAPNIGEVTVSLASSDPNVAAVSQPSLTFIQGSNSASFGVRTSAVAVDTEVAITVTLPPGPLTEGGTRTATLLVKAAPAATGVRSFFLDPLTVVGGNPVTGTVVLNGLAGPGGALVTLENGNPDVVIMPAGVTVPAGADRVNFAIGTNPVTAGANVGLIARFNGTFAATTLGVVPPLSLSSLALSPTSVVGGVSATGTVTMSAAAPSNSNGAVVALSSSNPSVASVPSTVTVPPGASSAGFTVTTSSVAASTSVTISASFDGTTRTATLTVTPASTGPLPAPSLVSPANDARFPPGQTITFDWTDVTGAASYTIEIDDSDRFTAPLLVSQTVTNSTTTISGLPAQRMWWRVRANDASGNPGAWSTVRRFELKN